MRSHAVLPYKWSSTMPVTVGAIQKKAPSPTETASGEGSSRPYVFKVTGRAWQPATA